MPESPPRRLRAGRTTLRSRWSITRRTRRLATSPLLADLPRGELARLDALATETTVVAGRTLAAEARRSNPVVVVLEGQAVAERDGEPLATIGPGGVFGCPDDGEIEVTVRSLTAMRLLVLHAADTVDLLDDAPRLVERLRQSAGRLRAGARHGDSPRVRSGAVG